MIAESPKMKPILQVMERVGPSDANVLITGEHGTGKELVAQWLHASSPRKTRSFIAVNMGGLSEGLFESELFGHVKGSFTDAKTDRVGRFELADQGTLFLDEIGTVPLSMQSKLLRVLQTGDVERVGSSKARHVDVRIVSATNANLQQEVGEGRFREDLLFRLNTIEIHLPALRDRREDIPALATHFLRRHATRYRKNLNSFDAGAMQLLLAHPWPGNIRELDHAVERAVLLAQGDQLRTGDLGLRAATSAAARLEDLPLEDVEKMLIQKALSRYDGNVSRAAQALGLSRSALYRRIASYGL
jgi:DNA-binding NtrC family response regulator